MERPKIRVLGLRYAVASTEILKGVDAEVPDGRITAVVGPSGAGKSTFLRAVNRLIEPTAGEVYLDGEPTDGMDLLRLRRRVGMVFQLPALFGQSVEEAILYGARLAGLPADTTRLLESRTPGGGRAPDSRPLHAPRQRLHRRHAGRTALLPLLFYGPPPTSNRP